MIKSKNSPTGNYPYDFQIAIVGFFHVDLKSAPENIQQIIGINAPAFLYSAAREILAASTSRGPYPGVILPTVTFADLKPAKMRSSQTGIKDDPGVMRKAKERAVAK